MSTLKRRKKKFNRKHKRPSKKWDNRRLSPSWKACIPLAAIILLVWTGAAVAQNTSSENMVSELRVGLDTLWVVIASVLVIFMNAGFAMLETGFCRGKNAVNILSKNLLDFGISTISFWTIGFAIMFGDGNSFFGTTGFLLAGLDNSPAVGDAYQGVYNALSWTGVPLAAKFLFQVAFAGTAATIVSGAVAERIKFVNYLVFSFLLVAFCYPVVGHWIWGNGWLAQMGFRDFAGSTVVHTVGGTAALVGTMFLGPRIDKYQADGTPNYLPGHNISLATLGCMILWIGWFGFNPGSTMAVNSSIAHIALTTNLAAAAGAIASTFTAWSLVGKSNLSIIINGLLAGLVAITAGCAYVGYGSAVAIGCVGGVLVSVSMLLLENMKIDDPVGAVPVHLVNGIWGTIAVGLFANSEVYYPSDVVVTGVFIDGNFAQLGIQLLGILAVAVISIVFSTVFWLMLKVIFGLRVTPEEELQGLDISEHGLEAYGQSYTETTDLLNN